ncbi:hypothetical protein [Acholeplasma granularum]|uniref:hypothetical protein n=1 Tax=Acholeplasma granularum TaxID=264635 RepID=UPI00046F7DDA|nr:hypothetical protein [Acholeplasma granularum]
MEALVIVLNDLSFMDDILDKFLELNVRGATIVDTQGMASAIMEKEGSGHALFSGPFYKSLVGDQNYSKTIFTVIPESFDKKNLIEEVRKILEQSERKVIGFMFTLPVSGIYPIHSKN